MSTKDPARLGNKNSGSQETGPYPDKGYSRAERQTSPEVASGRVIAAVEGKSAPEIQDILSELRRQAEAIQNGDMTRAEAMLINQAAALQALFTHNIELASVNGQLGHRVELTKLALRAQSQCRATLETLSAIKNPPVVYAKQANIAHGHQQVNNHTPTAPDSVAPRRRKKIKPQSQLLEDTDGQRLDTRATSPTSRTDSAVETMGEIHRTED